jgi:ATP-dependent helicase/nuclease subunit A
MAAADGKTLDLTGEQREALDLRGVSIALSAGAGCGKTFVLTERFLREIAPDGRAMRSELSEVVAITFTERAAREMRDRIRRKTRERLLEATDETEADFWLDVERQLDSARVSTIHAFCVSLLRSQAIEAGLDPTFAVLDEKQTQALQSAIVEDQLRRFLADRHPAAMELAFQLGIAQTLHFLGQTVRERYTLDFDRWRDATPDELLARWHEFFTNHYLPAKLTEFTTHPAWTTIQELCSGELPSDAKMRDRCEQLQSLFDGFTTCDDPAALLSRIKEEARIVGAKKDRDAVWSLEDYTRFQKAADTLRKRIDAALKERNRFAFAPEEARRSAEQGVNLLRLAEEVIAAYDAAKRDAAALDFEDLLILARNLLCGAEREPLRRAVGEQIRLLLVDEFQDTDPLQVDLVRALCDAALTAGKLFFVGDLKQSIYRFRGAQPEVFRALREAMPDAGRLPLTRNFRSQSEILAFVNALFCDELGPEYEPLVADRPQVTAPPAIEFLWAVTETEDDEDAPKQKGKEIEAEWIARRLRALLDGGDPLVFTRDAQGAPIARPAKQGDIAILLRAMTNVETYEAALRKYGIDYYVVGGHAFYAQQEVFDLLQLLRSLTSRADDVSLVGALRSPFFSLADETLYWLAQDPAGLHAAFFAPELPKQLSDDEWRKTEFAARTLTELRALKDRLPIAELVQQVLTRTGYDAILLAEFLGERKLANLHKLIDQARAMDAAGIFTLDDYVTQLAQFTDSPPKEPLAATLAENADVVRLMTIHQSKGLEFPVVVVPDMNATHRGQQATFAFDARLGPLVRAKRDDGLTGLDMWKVVNAVEDAAERSRLLYVAATRAADFLILSGSMKELGAMSGPWTRLLGSRFDLTTGELLATLPDGYDRPQVRVIASEPVCTRPDLERKSLPDWQAILHAARETAANGGGEIPATVRAIPVDPSARRRFSFSRLSGALVIEAPEDAPLTVTEAPVAHDAQAIGLLAHAVLERLDFARAESPDELVALYAPQFLPSGASEVDTVIDMLRRFGDSSTTRELARAKTIYRELPFQLRWPLDAPPDEAMTIEGVIDCLYEDAAGAWHLLDFKTNHVAAAGVPALARKYEAQLFLYATAIRAALDVEPASATLFFLAPGMPHAFTWSPDDRALLAESITAAIETLRASP